MFNTHLVVLNSFEAAKELLDRRSALYSDRWGSASIMQEDTYLIIFKANNDHVARPVGLYFKAFISV